MSTNDKTSSAPTKTRMTGAEVLVECLVREGVDVVFAYPGGASMPIHQALSHQPKIRTILPRHEQAARLERKATAVLRARWASVSPLPAPAPPT